jgi:predicted flap endonuclease-1-like 5' DNA nuclease
MPRKISDGGSVQPPRRPRSETHETASGGMVHTDNTGRVTRPSESRIMDEHISKSGKSMVIEHQDGVRESIDLRTGQDRVAKIPTPRLPSYEVNTQYVAPSNAQRRSVPRNEIRVQYNEHNTYLNSRTYVRQEPVFYSGYRWQPPVFEPLLYAAATLVALDEVYTPSMYRDNIANMTGVNYYAGNLARLGVNTSYDLIYRGRSPGDREVLAEETGVPVQEIRNAVGQADLMRVSGIGAHNSRLLVDAGITSVQDLARYSWDPEQLYEQLKYSSFYDGQRAPSRNAVASWIEQARMMPVAIYD